MCGIVGWVGTPHAPVDPELLRRMTRTLAHRGPDGEGVHVHGAVGLGHRRLSIVDIGGGAQPMRDCADRFAVSFNGEIFNHVALRRDLQSLGYRFTTRSDTEVLLHGYAAWGDGLVSRLNGMFAFVLHDRVEGRTLVARDRMGQKPLYYAPLDDGTLLVASELKALLVHPGVDRRVDPRALATYLTCEYVPWALSIVRGVRKLAPGDRLVHQDGAWTTEPWVDFDFGAGSPMRSSAEFIAETRATLARSVQRRLMSDVPLGVFLSGGIDSSAIVALMAEHVKPRDIQTFSIAFEDASFDESHWARQVAEHVGTHHRVRTFSAGAMLDMLPEVDAFLDEPFADASVLPTHLLSRFAREHVTVALGGDGGDELFAGYETFRADRVARLWRHAPRTVRDLAREVADRLPVGTSNFSLDFVIRRFVDGADADDAFRHPRWLSAVLPGAPNDPLLPEIRAEVGDGVVFAPMARPFLELDADPVTRLSWSYIRSYLAEDILTKVDRASMGCSLEVRAPFLDPTLVSLAARMPAHLKLRGLTAKYVLKRALADDLPAEILHRKKKGFGIPVAAWLKGPLSGEVDRLLHRDRLEAGGWFDPMVVRRLVDEHRAGRRDHRKALWTLMMFERWRERYDVVV